MKVATPSAERNPSDATPASAGGLLTSIEAAKYLRVSLRWLQQATAGGHIKRVSLALPGAQRGPVRYRPQDLDAYVARCQSSREGDR